MVYRILLSLLLIIFQVGDIALTEMILRRGGVELNPLIKRFGYWIKIPGVVLAIVAGVLVHPVILVPVILMSAGICIWNYRVLRKL